MSAVAHNPKFAKKAGVSQSVGKDFHNADKKVGKWEHPIKKATGGAIELGNGLSQFKGNSRPVRMPSTGMKYSNSRLNPGSELNRTIKLKTNFKKPKLAGGGMMNPQMPNRPMVNDPRMPMPQMLNQVNQQVAAPMAQLAAMRQRMPAPGRMPAPANPQGMRAYADGGSTKVGMSMSALKAISEALEHLSNRDTASASQTLRASKEAMQHPDVASAAASMRSGTGATSAQKKLTGLMEKSGDQNVEAFFEEGGMVACPHCGKHY